jgi:gliding motility-associated-like protein
VGFATPGLLNSQSESETEIQDEITCEPKAFSPNGDGYNDELNILFKLSKPGYIANVRIFDAVGRQVKFLVKNQSMAQEGSWLWDGKSESGQKLGIGVYIILVEVFDQDGHTKAFKKTCTITDRLE